jgi:hypothetical protein
MGIASGDGQFVNAYDPRRYDYRLLDFDRTHAFVASYVWKIPNGAGKLGNNWLARGLLNGWQISGITSIITGSPFELGVGIAGINGNQRITGSWTEPPRYKLKGDPKNAGNGMQINPDAIVIPEIGSDGFGPRMYMRNPGINNTDLTLAKKIRLGAKDTRRIELRFEMFNVFNHTQFSGVNAGTNLVVPNGTNAAGVPQFLTGNAIFARYNEAIVTNNMRSQSANQGAPLGQYFGEYNGARDPRIIELAVRFAW